MKKTTILGAFSFVAFCVFGCGFGQDVSAATYYVRTDGGTSTQCTGLADAAYPGSGTNQACAVNHPFWVLPPSGTPIFKGGDTLIIGSGQYQIGLGAPNTPTCNVNWPYDCLMATIPAGPDSTNKTKIYGKGWDAGCPSKPQLWGNERVWNVMTVGSNTEVQCLEITDHSACIESGPSDGTIGGFPVKCERSNPPFGPWAGYGLSIVSASTNIALKNLDIHGLANGGIFADRVGNIDLDYVNIIANGWRGWEGDGSSADDSYTGTINISHGKIEWNGCGEKYPLTTSNLSSSTDKHHCWEQQQGGYGDGIGLGDGSPGDWIITDSSVSWNTSDGVDLAHGNGNSTIRFIRSRAEGNNGNQLKSTGNAFVENSIIIGNCGFFQGQPFTSTKDISGATVAMNYCRAAGQSMSINVPLTSNRVYISNNTVLGNGDTLWMLAGAGCSGTTKSVTLRNNIFYGGDDWRYNYDNSPDREQAGFLWTEGSCTNTHIDEDYNIVYLTKSNNAGCVGTHSKCGVDPLFSGTIKQGPSGNYYTTPDYAQQLKLMSTSPAINAANPSITLNGTSDDYLNNVRGSAWDIGAYEYSTSTPDTTPPTSPTTLTANATSQSSITVSWNPATDDTGVVRYDIERCTGLSCSDFAQVGTTQSSPYIDSGLTASTGYSYHVRAVDVSGNVSGWSNVVGATTQAPDTQAPTTPSNVSASASSSSTINLTWTASTDNIAVTNYQVERCQGTSCTNFTQITTPTTNSFSDSGLTASTLYRYQVRATDGANNNSSYSSIAEATTQEVPPISDSLMIGLNFNEGTGTTTQDVSGHNNTGTLNSGAIWNTSGKNGGSVTFNGTSGYITVNDSNSLDLTTAMTLSAWVYPTRSSSWQTVMMKELDAIYYLYAGGNGANIPASGINIGGYKEISSTTSIPINTWTYLAVTWDGTTEQLYVNGTQMASTTVSGTLQNTANPLRIGGNTNWGEYFQGQIDDLRIYNTALTQSEIQTDMNTPLSAGGGTTPTACSTLTPSTWSSDPNHTGFATPYDLFNNNTLIVQASCIQESPTQLNLSIGNTTDTSLFSLMAGYYWDGSDWQSYTTDTCSGNQSGSWCQGETTGTITSTSINTSDQSNPQYFLGFTCKYTGSLPWKCGCQDEACTTPSWQLQGAALP